LVPLDRLHPAAVAWAEGRPAGEKWAFAFSGGADSLCLLLLAWAHWPGRRSSICALHFDHRLRGRAAAADALFCRAVCRALGVSFACGRWRAPPASPSEAEARSARFGFFDRGMGRRGIRTLFLGHQQDDVAETVLMRLARGSGAAGLAAPRPVQAGPQGRTHVRPILCLKRAEITVALREAGIPWREDASNGEGLFFRNRIRNKVLPAWALASGRDALSGVALSRELLEEDDAALEKWVDRLRPLTPSGALAIDRLAGQPRAVARRALHRWLLAQPGKSTLSRRGFDSLLNAVIRGSPTRHSLGAEGFAVIRGRWLRYASTARATEGRSV
jgi:tRNA(Ile)-lysidine synthase